MHYNKNLISSKKKNKKEVLLDFPDDPVVKNSPANAGHTGPIPGPGTPPHAMQQLNPSAAAAEPACPRAHALSQRSHPNEKPHGWRAARLTTPRQKPAHSNKDPE